MFPSVEEVSQRFVSAIASLPAPFVGGDFGLLFSLARRRDFPKMLSVDEPFSSGFLFLLHRRFLVISTHEQESAWLVFALGALAVPSSPDLRTPSPLLSDLLRGPLFLLDLFWGSG